MCFTSIIILVLLSVVVNSAKILVVVPTPSISHQVIFRPLIQELTERKHEMTVITTDAVYPQGSSPKNINEINLHDLSYEMWYACLSRLKGSERYGALFIMTVVFQCLSDIFSEQLKNESIQKHIEDKNVKFDLLILEASVNPALIFSYMFDAPVIQMSSFGVIPGNMEMIGSMTHPFLYPTHFHQTIYNLTIWDEIYELFNHGLFDRMLRKQETEDDKNLKTLFGTDIPLLAELKNNVNMLFLNIHPIWTHNVPMPPSVIYTWGIHKPVKKLLSKDLQSYLDSSENGVIYVSFGTNIRPSSFPAERLELFINVLSRLPYDVLWKYDLDELPRKPNNIKISKWFPQPELLKHPNVKLFITQGGLQSTEEAINAGVPVIGIPMVSDQEYNTAKYEHFKIGVKLHLKSLTEEKFENAINSVLKNENYRKNIIQLRAFLNDQPQTPLERAIWWTEYVIRHGGARHLRSPAANMSWAEYYELELVLIILISLLVLVTILLLTVHYCYKYFMRFLQQIKIKHS